MQIIDAPLRSRKGRNRHRNIKIDMTPMVDLGFLLITFFVITTELNRPTMTNLVMPMDGPNIPVAESKVLSILLDENESIYYYEGSWGKALRDGRIIKSPGAGLEIVRTVIQDKKKKIRSLDARGGDNLTILIKPGNKSTYKIMLDVLDEMIINQIGNYAIVDQAKEETIWLVSNRNRSIGI